MIRRLAYSSQTIELCPAHDNEQDAGAPLGEVLDARDHGCAVCDRRFSARSNSRSTPE